MKQSMYSVVLLTVLMLLPLVATSTKVTSAQKFYFKTDTRVVLNALTIYNPERKQCDSTPLITASNSKINMEELKNDNLRWMALSRDLLKRWKGKFHYGDTVLITSGDPAIDGLWIIKDTMNKRFKNRGDLLFSTHVRKLGKWKNVEVSKVSWATV
jgi:hypothetical protein